MSIFRAFFYSRKALQYSHAFTALGIITVLGVTPINAAPSSKNMVKKKSQSLSHTTPMQSSSAQKKRLTSTKPQKEAKKHPIMIGKEGNWTIYAVPQHHTGKLCYATSHPIQRLPKAVALGRARIFVSTRPKEGVQDEVNIAMDVPLNEKDMKAHLSIGSQSFSLMLKDSYGWIKNIGEEKNAILAMGKGSEALVKFQSQKGGIVTDHYSLKGLTKALQRVRRECS